MQISVTEPAENSSLPQLHSTTDILNIRQPRKQTQEGSLLHYKQHSVAYQLNLSSLPSYRSHPPSSSTHSWCSWPIEIGWSCLEISHSPSELPLLTCVYSVAIMADVSQHMCTTFVHPDSLCAFVHGMLSVSTRQVPRCTITYNCAVMIPGIHCSGGCRHGKKNQ